MLQTIITSGIIYLAVLVVIFITANQDKPTDENVVSDLSCDRNHGFM